MADQSKGADDGKRALRRGWTTGACAAAAARAAYEALLTGHFPDPVAIRLPGGARPAFALALKEKNDRNARAGVIKDAGDDPDVTHGALVIAEVTQAAPGSGISFQAGPGIGTVTKPGLVLAVGEPAINPGPRALIAAMLDDAARANGRAAADVAVTLSIPGGEALAAKTLNARLGIVGGLSVLGTTGIVIPYSCSAWLHSIHRGIDVARAMGCAHLAASTGSVSERAIQSRYALPEEALIDMGGFAGATLKYLRRHPVPRLTLAGGFGKVAKLAQGALDLHSDKSQVDIAALARLLEGLGAPRAIVEAATQAAGAGEVLAAVTPAFAGTLADRIAGLARSVALATLAGETAVEVAIFDRQGGLIGRAGT
jgi:cobalt-precorrin-5B (C1)-methyltransferase